MDKHEHLRARWHLYVHTHTSIRALEFCQNAIINRLKCTLKHQLFYIPYLPFFLVADLDGSGTIDFEEYVRVMATYCMYSKDEIMRFCFDCFDIDGSSKYANDIMLCYPMLRYITSSFVILFWLTFCYVMLLLRFEVRINISVGEIISYCSYATFSITSFLTSLFFSFIPLSISLIIILLTHFHLLLSVLDFLMVS